MKFMDKMRAKRAAEKALGIKKIKPVHSSAYPHEEELVNRILNLIYEYNNEISNVSAVGALELAKLQVIEDAKQ